MNRVRTSHCTCTLHSLAKGPVRPLVSYPLKGLVSHTIGAPGKQLPGAAITGRSHSARPCGAGAMFGSADPIRCLMGARKHPRYSPYALITTIGIGSLRKASVTFYVRMRKTPCTMAADQGTVTIEIQIANIVTCVCIRFSEHHHEQG